MNLLAILTTLMWLIAFGWFLTTLLTLYGLSRQRFLTPNTATGGPGNSLISILIPARNEQDRVLIECVRSILAQDYESFEVIAINDRSTDETGKMLETLAQTNERMRVVQGQDLPEGWLGKPYAMQQALKHARGDWILATDADMIFDKAALRTAMSRVGEENGDAITLIPKFEANSFWERIMIPTWAWVFLMYTLFYRIGNPRTEGAVGLGGFFLMRRRLLESVGGYEPLKNEVMEDVRLAEKIKRSGARLLTWHAPQLIRTRMYRTFGEMWECSTKNWFSGVKFSLPFALFCVFSMYLISVVPPLLTLVSASGIFSGINAGGWLLFIPAVLSWLLQILVLAMVSVRSDVPFVYGFAAPLGLGLIYAMLFDSTIRISTGIGVTWKGRRIYERNGVRPPKLDYRRGS